MFRIPWLILAVTAIGGCAQDPELRVMFDTEVIVSEGDEVEFDNAIVGNIDLITDEDDGTRVFMRVKSDVVKELHLGSAAIMRRSGERTYVELFDRGGRKRRLSNGSELIGLNNSIEYLAWQTGKSVDSAQSSLLEMTESLQDYFQGEEWASKRREVEQRG